MAKEHAWTLTDKTDDDIGKSYEKNMGYNRRTILRSSQ